MAQLGVPDMRIPIQYALTYPDRVAVTENGLGLDLISAGRLHFGKPDTKRFPSLDLAREALVQGGIMPCVLNAADEVAVEAFLNNRLRFSAIPRLIEEVMRQMDSQPDAVEFDGDVLEGDGKPGCRAGASEFRHISGLEEKCFYMVGSFVTDALVVVVVLGIMIFIHELGHFMAAKSFGVRVLVFSLGFGKTLLHIKRGDTDYRISALPFGGYVKMAGDDPSEVRQGEQGSFCPSPAGSALSLW